METFTLIGIDENGKIVDSVEFAYWVLKQDAIDYLTDNLEIIAILKNFTPVWTRDDYAVKVGA